MTEGELSALIADGKVKSFMIEAKIIRANGNIENRGLVSAKHTNPIKHILLQIKIAVNRLLSEIRYGKRFS